MFRNAVNGTFIRMYINMIVSIINRFRILYLYARYDKLKAYLSVYLRDLKVSSLLNACTRTSSKCTVPEKRLCSSDSAMSCSNMQRNDCAWLVVQKRRSSSLFTTTSSSESH